MSTAALREAANRMKWDSPFHRAVATLLVDDADWLDKERARLVNAFGDVRVARYYLPDTSKLNDIAEAYMEGVKG